MSFNEICKRALDIPASEHYGWRGALVFFQAVCFCVYLAATVRHRARLFVPSKLRRWDLDPLFMTMSTAAAASAVVTWAFWMEVSAAGVRAQIAIDANNAQQFAFHKEVSWRDNAAYLIFKPITIALCALPPPVPLALAIPHFLRRYTGSQVEDLGVLGFGFVFGFGYLFLGSGVFNFWVSV